jgi:tetratricopeptide (TPR) repeat protein
MPMLLAFCTILTAEQQTVIDLDALNNLYQEFRYKEVIRQGEKLLSQNPNIPVNLKCDIHRLLALSYYTEQDMQGALRHFSAILKLDTNYRLDPRENSPKILAFFEEIRQQFIEFSQRSETADKDSLFASSNRVWDESLQNAAYKRMALSIVLPGSGQIRRGEKTKGWLLLGGNAVLLGATIYFSAEANRLEDQYLQVTDPDQIPAAYSEYNDAYKKRNLSMAGFLILWLYTQADFIFFSSPADPMSNISWQPSLDNSGRTRLNLVFSF